MQKFIFRRRKKIFTNVRTRNECINCLQNLYKRFQKAGRGRPPKINDTLLCLACNLYFKYVH